MTERTDDTVMPENTENIRETDEGRILTVPNMMSLFRLLLIPLIVWLYVVKRRYLLVVVLLAVSAATDIADGYVARHFHQVSNLGKVLDPIADKFTEGVMMILLAVRYPAMVFALGAFLLCAFMMSLWGLKGIWAKKGVNSARWHGKATTVFLYVVIVILLLFPNIPLSAANLLIFAATLAVIGNMIGYGLFYRKLLRETKQEEK